MRLPSPLLLVLVVVLPGVFHIEGCHSDPACAPAPAVESWPADPAALTPGPAPATSSFAPASHPTFPPLSNTGGAELSPLRLVSVVTSGDPLHDALMAFGDDLVESHWLASFASDYDLASTGVNLHVDGPSLSGDVSVSDMRAYVLAAVSTVAPPDGHTLYMLYLPPPATAMEGGYANCGCNALGGAHTTLDDQGDALAYVQRCSASDDDAVTRTASHEVAEALTDTAGGYRVAPASPPWSGTVWGVAQNGTVEVGDLCSGTWITEGRWTYQRIWSTSASAAGGDPCVPPMESPYFDASAAEDWTAVAAGATVTIPIAGWSTGPRPDWYVYPILRYPPSADFTLGLTTANEQTLDGVSYAAINNGEIGTLSVTASSTATSGEYAVVHVVSRSADHVDGTHYWPVGVYVQ